MTKNLEIQRKRLKFRSWHRGTKELDLLLGRFADRQLGSLSAEQLDRYEALMEAPEPLIYAWIVGPDAPPPDFDHDIMRLLREFHAISPDSKSVAG